MQKVLRHCVTSVLTSPYSSLATTTFTKVRGLIIKSSRKIQEKVLAIKSNKNDFFTLLL